MNFDNVYQYMLEIIEISSKGYIPVAGMAIDRDYNINIELNDEHFHAEEKLLKYNPKILLVTLEPCPSCAYKILTSRIDYLFFGAYNKFYGAFGGKFLLSNQIANTKQIKVFGGIYDRLADKILLDFFKKRRA